MEVNSSRPKSLLFQRALAERLLPERQSLSTAVGGAPQYTPLLSKPPASDHVGEALLRHSKSRSNEGSPKPQNSARALAGSQATFAVFIQPAFPSLLKRTPIHRAQGDSGHKVSLEAVLVRPSKDQGRGRGRSFGRVAPDLPGTGAHAAPGARLLKSSGARLRPAPDAACRPSPGPRAWCGT